ncbi:MAG: class I SAM-dependent methyltransferase [Candidatus Bathyarchaeota archaeon]|nr:class I SAM-dependent methyltransferase [Candidatus Bathyarchaeota archaeon]
MVCHGGFSLDEEKRRAWYDPEGILRNIGLREGMVFMDIGCGQGFFSLLAAKVVGENGVVYAVDTDAQAIERLKARAAEKGVTNIHAIAGSAEETVFCTACADIVFFSMVLHDFADASKVLDNARKMLKPSGKVANLDWKKKPMSFGPPESIRFSAKTAAELMIHAGFTVENIADAGPHHYLVLGKP